MSRKPEPREITVDGQSVRVLDLAGQQGQITGGLRSGLSPRQVTMTQGVSARALRREVARKQRLDAKRLARERDQT